MRVSEAWAWPLDRLRRKFARVTPFGVVSKIYGGLFFSFFALFLLAHLIPGLEGEQPSAPITPVEAAMLGAVALSLVGLGVGVIREMTGGLMTVGGMIVFFYFELFGRPWGTRELDWGYLFFYLILLGGVLHVLSGTRLGLRRERS